VELLPPYQLVALEQVDEAVVRELRDQRLGDLAERDGQLQRAGQPLADPLQQADAVALALAAVPDRLAGDEHDSGDIAARPAHGRGVGADEDPRAVDTPGRERALPRPAAVDLHDHGPRLAGVALLEAEREQALAREVLGVVGEAEQRDGEVVGVLQAAVQVHDDHAGLDLPQHDIRGQQRPGRRARGLASRVHQELTRPRRGPS
jgi:hypothetical protein